MDYSGVVMRMVAKYGRMPTMMDCHCARLAWTVYRRSLNADYSADSWRQAGKEEWDRWLKIAISIRDA